MEHDAYLQVRRFVGLDGLRAFSAAFVVLFHAGVGGVVGRGIGGASTFFTISGFLVTTLLLREKRSTGSVSVPHFYLRRVLRIAPLYFAVLGVYIALVPNLTADRNAASTFFANLPYFATFTSNLFVDRSEGERAIFYFAWSLATQEQFYLVWPWLVRALRPWSAAAFAGVLMVADTGVREAIAAGAVIRDTLAVRILSGGWAPLCMGTFIAFALHHRRSFRVVRAVVGNAWSVPVAAGLAVLAVSSTSVPLPVAYSAIMFLVASVAVSPPRLLRLPLFVRIGTVSYGVYLMHMLAINLARRLAPGARPEVIAAIALLLSVVTAEMSFRWFERRFLELKELIRARRPRPGIEALHPGPKVPTVAPPGEL